MAFPTTLNATSGGTIDAFTATATASTPQLRVGVVGCGPAGMFFLRQLEKERERLLELKGKMEDEQQQREERGAGVLGGEQHHNDNGGSTTIDTINQRLSSLPHVTVFEKESRCGGLWQSKLQAPPSKNKQATNEESSQSQSQSQSNGTTQTQTQQTDDFEGMYDGMWINAPKEVFEFEDYTFDEHFGKPMPSFLTRSQVLKYLEGATNDALGKYKQIRQTDDDDDDESDRHGSILFDTEVSWITYNQEDGLFTVETVSAGTIPTVYNEEENYYDYDLEVLREHQFDKIIFATGSENLPKIPLRELLLLKGKRNNNDATNTNTNTNTTNTSTSTSTTSPPPPTTTTAITFDKPVLHSSQIKSLGTEVAGKNFLFIGAAYSAEDLALSFIKRGANHIYVTTRSDDGYPVTNTGHWPMNKLTVLMRNEIKEVLPGNKLRMGRMELATPVLQEIAKKYYNASHDSFVLEDIDAVIFCTGYDMNSDILDANLKYYAEYDGIDYNTDLRPDVDDDDQWPNIYDPEFFGSEELPSDKVQNMCTSDRVVERSPEVRANPTHSVHYLFDGTFNNHLISNPGLFFHYATFHTPLLDLDIHSAYILKVILGDIPTTDNKEELFRLRSLEMADMLRHSTYSRYQHDPVFYEAIVQQSYKDAARRMERGEQEPICVYPLAYALYKLFSRARQAGHPAGNMIVEKELRVPNNPKSQPLIRHGCDLLAIEFDETDHGDASSSSSSSRTTTTWVFSDKGIRFLIQFIEFEASHDDMEAGTNTTFRDIHYDSYRSVHTGTISRKFSKLWMEVDDLVGDDGEEEVPPSPTIAETGNDSDVVGKCNRSDAAAEGGCEDVYVKNGIDHSEL